MKDLHLSKQMQRAMAGEVEATGVARAKVLVSEGGQKAARALKETFDIMGEGGSAQ